MRNEIRICKLLFSGLWRYEPDTGYQRDLIESIARSQDGLTYIIVLKKENKWYKNHTPVGSLQAQDFVSALRFLLDPKNHNRQASSLFGIKNAYQIFKQHKPIDNLGIFALGDNILIINLEKQDLLFIYFFCYIAIPLHTQTIETHGHNYFLPKNIVTNGDFKLISYDPHCKIVLGGPMGIRNFIIMNSNLWLIKEFERKGLHLLQNLSIEEKNLYNSKLKYRMCYSPYREEIWGFNFNFRKKIFKNQFYRKAICSAIKKTYLCKYLFAQAAQPHNSIFSQLNMLKGYCNSNITPQLNHNFYQKFLKRYFKLVQKGPLIILFPMAMPRNIINSFCSMISINLKCAVEAHIHEPASWPSKCKESNYHLYFVKQLPDPTGIINSLTYYTHKNFRNFGECNSPIVNHMVKIANTKLHLKTYQTLINFAENYLIKKFLTIPILATRNVLLKQQLYNFIPDSFSFGNQLKMYTFE